MCVPQLASSASRCTLPCVQGQFKQQVPFDSLMIGSEFSRPLKLPASSLLLRATQWLISKMGSGVQLNPTGDQPHIFAPLIGAAQTINASLPGQQPDLLEAEEDMTLYDSSLVSGWSGKAMSPGKRRSFFASRSNRQGRNFDTEHVWTFQLYDQTMDYSTFTLPIPLFKLDLVQVRTGVGEGKSSNPSVVPSFGIQQQQLTPAALLQHAWMFVFHA